MPGRARRCSGGCGGRRSGCRAGLLFRYVTIKACGGVAAGGGFSRRRTMAGLRQAVTAPGARPRWCGADVERIGGVGSGQIVAISKQKCRTAAHGKRLEIRNGGRVGAAQRGVRGRGAGVRIVGDRDACARDGCSRGAYSWARVCLRAHGLGVGIRHRRCDGCARPRAGAWVRCAACGTSWHGCARRLCHRHVARARAGAAGRIARARSCRRGGRVGGRDWRG